MSIRCHLLKEENIKKAFVQTKKTCIKMYKNLLSLRALEEFLRDKYDSGKIRGFCHLVTGQENIYIGLQNILEKEDKVIGSYRCHGLAYICGISMESIISETLGKINGICKGKGGSMHMYNKQFYGGHGIVGAQVSLGTGLAYGLKYMKMKNVCFVFYGDGAANQGQVFESLNMAMLWKLPVVFVCEDNMYSMWTPEKNVTSYTDYYKRGYNIPGIRVSDQEIGNLIDVFKFAREHALSNGPIIVHIDTYRTCGHSCVDADDFYRPKQEVQDRLNQDCLKTFKQKLNTFVTEVEVKQIETEVLNKFQHEVEKGVFVKSPPIDELCTDVYK